MDWIQEEEHLRNLKELLQKQPLEQVCIRVIFVDSESNVLTDTSFKQQLTNDVVRTPKRSVSETLAQQSVGVRGIDCEEDLSSKVIERQQSILSNTALLQCIQTAKTEYLASLPRGFDSMYSVSFSVMDVLLWNVDVETDHLQKYAETLPPEWIGREFIKGNIYEDIVFMPSLCIFHSIQSVYVFLRVSFRKNITDVSVVSSSAPKKYTRRRNVR